MAEPAAHNGLGVRSIRTVPTNVFWNFLKIMEDIMKQRRVNPVARALRDRHLKPRVVKPPRGRGAYSRTGKKNAVLPGKAPSLMTFPQVERPGPIAQQQNVALGLMQNNRFNREGGRAGTCRDHHSFHGRLAERLGPRPISASREVRLLHLPPFSAVN